MTTVLRKYIKHPKEDNCQTCLSDMGGAGDVIIMYVNEQAGPDRTGLNQPNPEQSTYVPQCTCTSNYSLQQDDLFQSSCP